MVTGIYEPALMAAIYAPLVRAFVRFVAWGLTSAVDEYARDMSCGWGDGDPHCVLCGQTLLEQSS